MSSVCLVSILCPDRVGLLSAITGRLFDLGINLGDAGFAAIGRGAEFTAICEVPAHLSAEDLRGELAALPELEGAELRVTPYGFDLTPSDLTRITHRIELGGGDQPGLIARLSEILTQFGANIVRLEAQKLPDAGEGRYVTRFAVAIPVERASHCLAAVENTAGSLGLTCETEEEETPQ